MILGFGWNQLESSTPNDCTTAGTYTDPGNALATFNSLLPAANMKLSLSILPVSTTLSLMPANFSARAFDDPLVTCRYKKLLEFVHSRIPNAELVSMQFGNEVDLYAGANQVSFWTQYWGFYVNVSAAAKELWPGLRTSVIGTLAGLIGESSNPLAQWGLEQIYNSADVVVLTHYPLNADFTVQKPNGIERALKAVVERWPSKEIVFNELGFQSGSSYDGSSQALQKQFVGDVFAAWDRYPSRITGINFLRLNDLSHAAAQTLAASYGLGASPAAG